MSFANNKVLPKAGSYISELSQVRVQLKGHKLMIML